MKKVAETKLSNSMTMPKLKINASIEYDALRQELLKRIETHSTIVNMNLTFSGVLLGFGVGNNLIALILPPIVMFLVIIQKNNTLGAMKIATYLNHFYAIEGSQMNWEVFNDMIESSSYIKARRNLFGLGSLGVFLTSPIIAIAIGVLNYKGTMLEKFLLVVGGLSVATIIFLFIFVSTRRMKNWIRSLEIDKK